MQPSDPPEISPAICQEGSIVPYYITSNCCRFPAFGYDSCELERGGEPITDMEEPSPDEVLTRRQQWTPDESARSAATLPERALEASQLSSQATQPLATRKKQSEVKLGAAVAQRDTTVHSPAIKKDCGSVERERERERENERERERESQASDCLVYTARKLCMLSLTG